MFNGRNDVAFVLGESSKPSGQTLSSDVTPLLSDDGGLADDSNSHDHQQNYSDRLHLGVFTMTAHCNKQNHSHKRTISLQLESPSQINEVSKTIKADILVTI